jgi:tRNA A37 threonylcarbamoyladenosine synthetase subunit TsaC/SUA5/YrdC
LKAVDIVVSGGKGSGEASAVVDLSRGKVELLRADNQLSTEKLARLASEWGDKTESV